MTTAVIFCITALSGCQKAPEASDDQDIPHAQSVLEQQINDIAGENTEGGPGQQTGGVYERILGTTDNKIHINAQIPDVPANVYRITLKPNEALDMDALTAFLDSAGGNPEDTSQALSEEIEKSEYDNTHGDEPVFYSLFGDHSALQLTDGERKASFARHTSADYLAPVLRDTYFANAQTSTIIPLDRQDTGSDFSVKEAEQILYNKLGALGITEIAFHEIELYEGNGYRFYNFGFVPSYEGISLIHELGGGYSFGEVYPFGYASITPEGAAILNLADFCGRVAAKEPVSILSFEQIEKILEQYLDSGRIQGNEQLTLNNIKLEYYPIPNPAPAKGEIEYKSELELIPIWHIYMSLDDYVESRYQGDGLDDALYNICINAVTGEIEKTN